MSAPGLLRAGCASRTVGAAEPDVARRAG